MSDIVTTPVIVIDGGKQLKGNLTLFSDEYVVSGVRSRVDWEKVICRKSTYSMKSFFKSVEKTALSFDGIGDNRIYVLEERDLERVINTVNSFVSEKKSIREKKELQERKVNEERQRPVDEQEKKKAVAGVAQQKPEEKKQAEALAAIKIEEKKINCERIALEKKSRIDKILSTSQQSEVIEVPSVAQKAASLFLDNPYRLLGVSCMSSIEEANNALDKLKKLARLKALGSYTSPYDLAGLEKPDRDLSIVQNALILIKDRTHRWYWFSSSNSCKVWNNGKYRIELVKDGMEYGTYDLFISNYLYAIVCDSDVNVPETWKRIFNYYCFIIGENGKHILKSRYLNDELSLVSESEMVVEFKKAFAKPLLLLCDRDDLAAVIRLHNLIKECDNPLLDDIERTVLSKLVNWFTEKETAVFSFLRKYDDVEAISDADREQIKQKGEAYCSAVEPILETVLNDFRGSSVRYDMIKESYRHTTYQLMYVLHKCADKTDAIIFANRCFSYCKPDDKKRIQNTFGAVNIKSIDWSKPHTSWDIKGDNFYYGRGCQVDYSQAFVWYHQAADAGNMYSKNSLGLCYLYGNGVPKDVNIAVSWFEDAYDAGNPDGAYNLAECYYTGTGVEEDIDSALKYWAEAAKLGHPSADDKRKKIYAEVQVERKKCRAKNHICHDVGFQMITGSRLVVEITTNQPINAYLVNAQGYRDYLDGKDFRYEGGHASGSSYRIVIPSSNHWYLILDNGKDSITGIETSFKVMRG